MTRTEYKRNWARQHPKRNRLRGTPQHYEKLRLLQMGLKQCKQCEAILPLTSYWTCNGLPRSRCSVCDTVRQKEWRKTYKDRNTEKKRERAKRWREQHVELANQRIAEVQRKRRACRTYVVTQQDYLSQVRRQNNRCYICWAVLTVYHIEHVIPLMRGGQHSVGNVLIACPKCNKGKGTKFLVEVRYRERAGRLGIYDRA